MAAVLSVSPATVSRDQKTAEAWLAWRADGAVSAVTLTPDRWQRLDEPSTRRSMLTSIGRPLSLATAGDPDLWRQLAGMLAHSTTAAERSPA
jgi:hypothetical protein